MTKLSIRTFLLLLSSIAMDVQSRCREPRQAIKITSNTYLNSSMILRQKFTTYDVVQVDASRDEACRDMIDLYSIGQQLRQALDEVANKSSLQSIAALFVYKMTWLQTYMEFFEGDDEVLGMTCTLTGLENQTDDGSCLTETPGPGCLRCLVHDFFNSETIFHPNCSWLFGDFEEAQNQLLAMNNVASSTMQIPLRNVTIVNCTSERTLPEEEANELFQQLLNDFENDLSVLREGETILNDFKKMLGVLKGMWEPQIRRKRSTNDFDGRSRSLELREDSECKLNSNDDPRYLTEQLKKTTDLWRDDLSDYGRLLEVACYLTKISSVTMKETLDQGLDGRTRDADISQMMQDLVDSAPAIGEEINLLETRIGGAKINVTEALSSNLDRVHVCV